MGFTQEDFGVISSRTYVSTLERGLKSPTIVKVDELAKVINIHPLTLLALCYLPQGTEKSMAVLLKGSEEEMSMILKLRSSPP